MAENPSTPQPSTPPPASLEQGEYIPDHDDGEVILAFFRRHGPWIVFVVLATALFIGYGSHNESTERGQRFELAEHLEDILEDFHKNPVEKRALIEDVLKKEIVAQSPLKDWLDFLLLNTYILEGQKILAETGASTPGALEKINEFIDSHESHPELTAFAYLSKAVVLEDLGQLEESQTAFEQINKFPFSTAHHLSQKIMEASSQQERHTLWQNYLKQSAP